MKQNLIKKLRLTPVRLLILFIIGFAIGIRVFNHLNAWLGVLIISATLIFTVYKLLKTIQNEKF